jgi:hypothetical protein
MTPIHYKDSRASGRHPHGTCNVQKYGEVVQESTTAMERIEYISMVQKGRDVEEHDIRVLRERSIDHINKSVEYLEKMVHGSLIGRFRKNGPSARRFGSKSTRQ